jgi:hypothetical protein
LLNKLVRTPEYFSADDLKLALDQLFTPGVVPEVQIGSFLTALHIHRVERRPESLAAAAAVLRARALKADVEDRDNDFIVDIVGTGGDGYDLFNASTTAGIIAAGARARVIKVSLLRFFPLTFSDTLTMISTVPDRIHPTQVRQTFWNRSESSSPPQRTAPRLPSQTLRSPSFWHPISIPVLSPSVPIANHSLSARCSTS